MGRKRTAISNEEIIAALMDSRSIADAASKLGISERSIYDKMTNKFFQMEYNAAKADFLREALNSLKQRTGAAIATIAELMEAQETAPAIRLQAAKMILDSASRFAERLDSSDKATSQTGEKAWFDQFSD